MFAGHALYKKMMVRKFVILVFVACRRDWFCGALSGNGGCGCRLRGGRVYPCDAGEDGEYFRYPGAPPGTDGLGGYNRKGLPEIMLMRTAPVHKCR